MNNNNIDYATLAAKDAAFVLTLINNGEFDRALGWSKILTTTINLAMVKKGITPSNAYTHTNGTVTQVR